MTEKLTMSQAALILAEYSMIDNPTSEEKFIMDYMAQHIAALAAEEEKEDAQCDQE